MRNEREMVISDSLIIFYNYLFEQRMHFVFFIIKDIFNLLR